MFHWYSEYLRLYEKGDIVVMAESIEEARGKATKNFLDNFNERHGFTEKDYEGSDNLNKDRAESLAHEQDVFNKDIAKEPFILEEGVMFVQGRD